MRVCGEEEGEGSLEEEEEGGDKLTFDVCIFFLC
jgi:hypothetical protein